MACFSHRARGRRLPSSVAILFVLGVAASAEARPARPAPALPTPTGTIVNVSTEAQLQAAMSAIASNVTIVLAPGTYRLTRSLYFSGASGTLTNIGLRGATDNSDDVVLIGPGMTQADYGSVPYGIWTGNGVDGISIANLTIRDFYFHPIIFNGGTQRPHVYNVHLIDAGQQFIKSNPDAAAIGASDGIVEYSIFEFTTTARDDYPKAIDVQGGANWMIRHNLFRNLQAPGGQLIGPAVLVWRGSSNTVTEGNTFLNCGRGIMYGAEDAVGFAHSGGIIRNNFFFRSNSQPGDVGIQVADSPDTQVVHNTVLLSGTYRAAIEYRYPSASGLVIANNLIDAPTWARDGATATLMANVMDATSALFVNAAAGDLHLLGSSAVAIDQGVAVPAAGDDWDGDLRPSGVASDIGADEYVTPTNAHQIAGRVMSTATGTAVPGVTVSLTGAASQAMTTDPAGTYAFPGLVEGGNYAVTAVMEGYAFSPDGHYYYPLTGDATGADFFGTPIVTVNQPPSVALVVSSLAMVTGDRLTLTAIASDSDGGISQVSFYANQKLIGNDGTNPYSMSWKPTKAAVYSLVAVASDIAGSTAASVPVVVTVTARSRR